MTSHDYKQNEISQELRMGTKIFKTSYYSVLKPSFHLVVSCRWHDKQ
jgi:hypothetical protein